MVFDLTEYSSSRISSHQLLPPVNSVLVMLVSVQLIPVCLIKLPPVTSLFLGCTIQHETAKFNPSLAAASGKATVNLRQIRFFPWYSMRYYTIVEIPIYNVLFFWH